MTTIERQVQLVTATALRERMRARPLSFSRNVNGLYAGQHLFLLLSGPSLASVDRVALNAPGVLTMGVNNSPSVIRPKLWIGGDDPRRFVASVWRDPTITKFVPSSHLQRRTPDGDRVSEHPGVVLFHNQTVKAWTPEQYLLSDSVQWGDDKSRLSMVAAIRIAVALGVCRIVLVGCDWRMNEAKPYAFDQARLPNVVKANNGYYRVWSDRFARLRPILEQHGVEVVNATPGSHLQAFERITLADAITDAMECFGVDVGAETTAGMYDKR